MEQQKIQVRDITVAYEQTIVIPKLNLNIPGGKITIVVGGNGCGKSTLIKSVAGILKPKKGEILINGTEIKKQAPKPAGTGGTFSKGTGGIRAVSLPETCRRTDRT